jgi:hypothetical protein
MGIFFSVSFKSKRLSFAKLQRKSHATTPRRSVEAMSQYSRCAVASLREYTFARNNISFKNSNFTFKTHSNSFKMQVSQINERELVSKCMKALSEKAGFADPATMVQRDLEFLSESIQSQTGILISLSTLKRLFNGQFSRLPQVATLNAISQFLDYRNWQDYRNANAANTNVANANGANERVESGNSQDMGANVANLTDGRIHLTRRGFTYARFFLFAGILIVVALGLLAMLKLRKPVADGFKKAQFVVKKTTSNALPNSVVFSYNIDEVNADSFFIQQSWDKHRRVRIYKGSHTLTDIYYEPGYHVAKLIANDQVIKTQDVSIPTDRWFFYAKEKTPGSLPKYINITRDFNTGPLLLTKEELVNSQVNIEKEHNYIHVYFPSAIEKSSDNFRMVCRVRVHPVNNTFCPYLMSEIFMQRNFMYFINSSKGCASELKAQFSDTIISGKTNDLSSLGVDVKEWHNLELLVKNKNAVISIDGKEVFSAPYKQSGGLITGLGFISNGLCEIESANVELLDGRALIGTRIEASKRQSLER